MCVPVSRFTTEALSPEIVCSVFSVFQLIKSGGRDEITTELYLHVQIEVGCRCE